MFANRGDLLRRKCRGAGRVHDSLEVASGQRPRRLAQPFARADELDLLVRGERGLHVREAVAVTGHVDAHWLAQCAFPVYSCENCARRRPSPRTDSTVSTPLGLSAACRTGRSSSDQSPFLTTKKSFCAWLSLTARITQ